MNLRQGDLMTRLQRTTFTLLSLAALLCIITSRADEPSRTAPASTTAQPALQQVKTSTGDAYTTYLQDVNVAKDQLDIAVNLVNTPQTVRASYMGVGVEIPGDTLRSQLKLPEGTGLVINWIDDAGPAKGILHQHDVLQKLEDQLLINGEQLVTLVRLHKPGETIQLTILRE